MTIDDQRNLGIQLSNQNNAPRTMALINKENSQFTEIFKTAVEELGADKLVSIILEQNIPSWSEYALRYIPNLGNNQDALTKQAEVRTNGLILDVTKPAIVSLGGIAAFELYIVAGASYCASFTMYWDIAPGAEEPKTGYSPATPPYKWSSQKPVGQSATELCSFFALPKAPLNPGNIVWMIVDVVGGHYVSTNFYYTYDPIHGGKALINADGGTLSPSFTQEIIY